MDPDFEEHLTDTAHTVVAFAGGPQNRFQFRNVLGKLGVSHVLLQDSTQRYFLDGVKGIGDRDAVVKYLRRLMYERVHWVTTVGVSSGSYAALFYGQIAPVDEVIAISPLTTRQPSADIDPKWHSQIFDPNLPNLPDLKDFFPGGPVPRVRAFISDGDGCWIDRQMAERIGCEEITLVPGHSHGDLARGMRDRGMFAELFGCETASRPVTAGDGDKPERCPRPWRDDDGTAACCIKNGHCGCDNQPALRGDGSEGR